MFFLGNTASKQKKKKKGKKALPNRGVHKRSAGTMQDAYARYRQRATRMDAQGTEEAQRYLQDATRTFLHGCGARKQRCHIKLSAADYGQTRFVINSTFNTRIAAGTEHLANVGRDASLQVDAGEFKGCVIRLERPGIHCDMNGCFPMPDFVKVVLDCHDVADAADHAPHQHADRQNEPPLGAN